MSDRGRWWLVGLLSLVLALLTAAVLAGAWVRLVLAVTDRYVAAVDPLVDDPLVQRALSDEIAEQVLAAIDTEQLVAEVLEQIPLVGAVLPDDLVESLQDEVSSLVRDTVDDFVASDAFAAAWQSANQTGHEQVVAVLIGRGDPPPPGTETAITVDADVFVDAFRSALSASGRDGIAGLVPDIDASFVVYANDALPSVRATLQLLDRVAPWLWVLALGAAAMAVLMAPRRPLGVAFAAGGTALGGLLLTTGTLLARQGYLDDPQALLPRSARADVFDRLATPLLLGALVVGLLGLTVAAIGLLRAYRWSGDDQLATNDDQSP